MGLFSVDVLLEGGLFSVEYLSVEGRHLTL